MVKNYFAWVNKLSASENDAVKRKAKKEKI